MNQGTFITFEGPDSSGKSTQVALLQRYLKEQNVEFVFTRDPGGTEIGEKIREIILNKDHTGMNYVTESLLYAACRAQLVSEVIKPSLNKGLIVISDRFIDSSLAYQGVGRELGSIVEEMNSYSIKECAPDLTILLKVSTETGEARRQTREKDRLEIEEKAFHEKVYKAYLDLEKKYPSRIIGIDGTKSIDEIHKKIVTCVEKLVSDKRR